MCRFSRTIATPQEKVCADRIPLFQKIQYLNTNVFWLRESITNNFFFFTTKYIQNALIKFIILSVILYFYNISRNRHI